MTLAQVERRIDQAEGRDAAAGADPGPGHAVDAAMPQRLGIARIGEFTVAEDIQRGDLVPLLQAFNPGDKEPIHAVFVGGSAMPARVRVFVDFLVEHHRM